MTELITHQLEMNAGIHAARGELESNHSGSGIVHRTARDASGNRETERRARIREQGAA